MDEIEKAKRRKLKESAASWLEDEGLAKVSEYDLGAVDSRLYDYCARVIGNPDSHNLFELLAVKRFLSFFDKYTFRRKEAKKVLLALETFRFPSKDGMRPLRLTPVEVFLICGIYGFFKDDGKRLIQYVMLFVPRKFGKTTLVAGIAEYDLIFGDSDAQVYVCANSYNQAKICFDNIRNSLRALDKSGNRFQVNREAVFNRMRGKTSFAKCLAADPSTLDGLNASTYILDEFSQAKSAELRNVMATSTGTRDNPLELIITTASDLLDGPCVETLKSYRRILMEETEDDSVFALLFEPDVDDAEDDPVTWSKVQPHLGITVKEDYYEGKWLKARQTAEDMLAFRTKLLNVFATDESKAWLTGDEIRERFVPFSFSSLVTQPFCMVSFDLSVWDDFSCVCYGIYRQDMGNFHFHLDYYLPEETLERHPNRELYRLWADKGFLKVLKGKTIDYDAIINDIIGHNGALRIVGIGYDPYKSKQAVNMLQASGAGGVLKGIRQTYGEFTGAVETLELLVKTGGCTFSPNDITAWCFGNCQMDEDRIGNRKPIKRFPTGKIDGAITTLMIIILFINFKR